MGSGREEASVAEIIGVAEGAIGKIAEVQLKLGDPIPSCPGLLPGVGDDLELIVKRLRSLSS